MTRQFDKPHVQLAYHSVSNESIQTTYESIQFIWRHKHQKCLWPLSGSPKLITTGTERSKIILTKIFISDKLFICLHKENKTCYLHLVTNLFDKIQHDKTQLLIPSFYNTKPAKPPKYQADQP